MGDANKNDFGFRNFQDESAVFLLQTLVEKEGFSRKASYLQNIIVTQILQHNAKVYRRLPEESLEGLESGGREAIKAAILLRGDAAARGTDRADDVPERTPEETVMLLEQWARAEGIWFENADKSLKGELPFLAEGGEARVFRADGENLVKIINAPGAGGVVQLMDRIALHNFLFPETNMDVIAFGRSDSGEFCVIVNQPYVRGLCSSLADTARMVVDAGFHLIDGKRIPYTFFTDYYCLGDLHERNVLKTEDGELKVIDCDVRLNTPELDYGGRWVVSEPAVSEKEVDEIERNLNEVLPWVVNRNWLEEYLSDDENRLSEQLELTGRYNGFLTVMTKSGEMDVCLEVNPDNPSEILLTTKENIRKMIPELPDFHLGDDELRMLQLGYGVFVGDQYFAFSINRGEVLESADFSMALGKKLREKHTSSERSRETAQKDILSKKTPRL